MKRSSSGKFWEILLVLVICSALILPAGIKNAHAALSDSQVEAIKYRIKGYMYQRKGMFDNALNMYRKALEVYPFYACAHNDLGILYEQKGWLGKAETEYLKALEIDPEYTCVHTNLALLYERKGELENAYEYWSKRAALGRVDDPWTLKAKEQKAYLEITFKKEKKEIPKVRKVKKAKVRKPAKKPTKKITKEPLKAPPAQGTEAEMAQILAEQIAMNKRGLIVQRKKSAQQLYKEGLKLYRATKYENALVKLHNAAELDPENNNFTKYIQKCMERIESRKQRIQREVEKSFRSGQNHYLEKRFDRALTQFEKVAKLNPNYPNIQNTIQEVQQAKQKAEAEKYAKSERKRLSRKTKGRYKKQGKISKNIKLHMQKGQKYLDRGRFDLALAQFEKVRELDPNYPGIRDILKQTKWAKKQSMIEAEVKSVQAVKKPLPAKSTKKQKQIRKQKEKTANLRAKEEELRAKQKERVARRTATLMRNAQNYIDRKKYTSALKKLKEIENLDPGFTGLDVLIRQTEREIERVEQEKEQERLIKQAKKSLGRGQKYYRKGKYEEAIEELEKVIAVTPNHPEATRLLRYCRRRVKGTSYYTRQTTTAKPRVKVPTYDVETEPAQIAVYPNLPTGMQLKADGLDRNYEILGIVAHRTTNKDIDALNEELLKKGKLQGADHIIQIRYFEYDDDYLYGYGTAVKLKR